MGLAPPHDNGVKAGARHCRMTCPVSLHATTAGTARRGGARAGGETRRQPTVSTALVSDLPGMLAQRRTIHVERGEPMTEEGHAEYRAAWDGLSGAPRSIRMTWSGGRIRAPTRPPWSRCCITVGWSLGLSTGRSPSCGTGGWRCSSIVLAEAQRQRYFPLAQGPLTSARTAAATSARGSAAARRRGIPASTCGHL